MEQNNSKPTSPSEITPHIKKRKKPSKNAGRAPSDNSNEHTHDKSIPKGLGDKRKQRTGEIMTPQQKLRDRINQMRKDRAKGSYVCEENANHEY